MADKKDQKEIIPSTLTELALMLLFGFMLTAAHFAKEAAGLQARAEDAETKLRSRALPSCGFHDPARTRPALIFIFKKRSDGRYAVRLNTNYHNIVANGMIRQVPQPLVRQFQTEQIILEADLATVLPPSALVPVDQTTADACVFNASINGYSNTPTALSGLFYWTEIRDKPPGSP